MDDRQGRRSCKASIIKGLNAAVSPINVQTDNHLVIGGTGHYLQETNCRSPTVLDPYSEKLDLSTPVARYFRSRSPVVGKLPSVGDAFSSPLTDVINANYRSAIINHYASSSSGSGSFGSRGGGSSLSPLSAVENLETPPERSPQIYGTPVKVDDEVLVMDGILVSSVSGGARMKSASDSGGGGGSSSVKCLYKTDICRAWEDSGSCRYGYKCQFAHGKEEIRSARLPVKNKPKLRNSHQLMGVKVTASETINKTDLITRSLGQMSLTSTASIQNMNTKPAPISTVPIKDWSPEDDGIKIILSNSSNGETSNREDVDRYIHEVLYGSTETTIQTKKRLSIFVQICPEN